MPVRQIVRTFGPFVRPHWPGYLLAGLLAVVGTGLGLLKPWPLKYLFDEVLLDPGGAQPGVGGLLLAVVAALMVVTVLDSLVGALRGYVLTVIGERVAAAVRTRLYGHLQRLPLHFHQATPLGELTTRLTADVDKIRSLVTTTLVDATTNVLTLVGMVAVLLVLDWQLSVALLVLLPLLGSTVVAFRRRIRSAEEHSRDVEGELATAAQEKLGAVTLVKSLGLEEHEAGRFAERAQRAVAAVTAATRTASAFTVTLDLIVAAAVSALVWLGAQRVLSGALTPGDLVIFTAYLRDVLGPTRALSKLSALLARAGVRAARIDDVLSRPLAVVDRPDAVPAPRPVQGLRLEGVSFAYPGGPPVLTDIDLEVPVGSSVAIVGPTGAGKSTIAALLTRLQDPTAGRVLLDGVDLRDLTSDSVHEHVGLVLQDAHLFRATVRENIAYARPGAGPEQVERAARVAQAHEFVARLPEGYDTLLAERGASLSGGQRQRLALARSVLRDCPVLVLDEPTTGLDARSERAVLDALDAVRDGRTTVVITHRMAAACTADEVVVLESGRVVERGRHDDLVAAGGLYAELCRLQGLVPATGAAPAAHGTGRRASRVPVLPALPVPSRVPGVTVHPRSESRAPLGTPQPQETP